ncbi:hypothetical protein BLS_000302 [Venturia inaequalis]|nr:hypothetical protein BLS_000302 [Venturia inaequalis]
MTKTALVIHASGMDAGKSGQPGNEVSSLTTYLVAFNRQLVTLFTILFITTIATLVKRSVLYKGQRGASITILEQYQGSTTLPSTIKITLRMRSWTAKSVLLLFICIWYYFGSQAAEHEYNYVMSTRLQNTHLIYTNQDRNSDFLDTAALTPLRLAAINSAFTSSIRTTERQKGHDHNRAAILPFLNQTATGQLLGTGKDGWATISSKTGPAIHFSSTRGISMTYFIASSTPATFTGTYHMTTSYIYANCPQAIPGPTSHLPMGVPVDYLQPLAINDNFQLVNNFPQIEVSYRRGNIALFATCTLEQHHIEIQTKCDFLSCFVDKIRPDPRAVKFATPAIVFTYWSMTDSFFQNLILSVGKKTSETEDQMTLVEANIGVAYDSVTNAFVSTLLGTNDTALALSHGLSRLINGYLTASLPEVADPATLDRKYIEALLNNTIPRPEYSIAQAFGAAYAPQYYIRKSWIIIDFMACTVLLVSAIVATWLRLETVKPQVLDLASGITQDGTTLERRE